LTDVKNLKQLDSAAVTRVHSSTTEEEVASDQNEFLSHSKPVSVVEKSEVSSSNEQSSVETPWYERFSNVDAIPRSDGPHRLIPTTATCILFAAVLYIVL
jgi:hypothetical protein